MGLTKNSNNRKIKAKHVEGDVFIGNKYGIDAQEHKKTCEELKNKILAEMRANGEEITQAVSQNVSAIVHNAVFCAVSNITEEQRASEQLIKQTARENFKNLQDGQAEFADRILKELQKQSSDLDTAIEKLGEKYASKASSLLNQISGRLEVIQTTVFGIKNTVEAQREEFLKFNSSAINVFKKITNEADSKIKSYWNSIKAGWHFLCSGRFDNAFSEFKLARFYKNDGYEAYFGMALADHKIQFLDVNAEDAEYHGELRQIPICCEIPDVLGERFSLSPYYERAMSLTKGIDGSSHKMYANCASEIDKIISYFVKHKQDNKKYDCFICAKVSELDENGKPDYSRKTEDCAWAKKLHKKLSDKKLNPFFSEIDIDEKQIGAEYEALILYALVHSKCMVIVCSKQEYFDNSQYMQNEYKRFKGFLRGRGKTDLSNIIIVCKDKKISLGADYNSKNEQQERPDNAEENEITRKKEEIAFERVISRVSSIIKGVNYSSIIKYCPLCGKAYTGEDDYLCTKDGAELISQSEFEAAKLAKLVEFIDKQKQSSQKNAEKAKFEADKILKEAERQAQEKFREADEYRRKAEAEAERNAKIFERRMEEQKQREEQIIREKTEVENKLKEVQRRLLAEYRAKVQELKQREAELEKKAEAERKAQESSNYPTLDNYDKNEFKIEGTVLKKYTGKNSVVNIPQGVTQIGDYAFNFCTKLTSITVPNSVVNIGDSAFKGCRKLANINIPDSVACICRNAFFDTAYYNNANNWENGVLYIGKHLIKAESEINGYYTVKQGTINIADSAFCGCSSLTDIKIPDSVISIGWGAFGNCSSLTNISIPDSVISIDNFAFGYCRKLTNITIPNNVIKIGDSAFEGCRRLKSVTIPERFKNDLQRIFVDDKKHIGFIFI